MRSTIYSCLAVFNAMLHLGCQTTCLRDETGTRDLSHARLKENRGYSCPHCGLRNADFSGKDLTDANLAGADLTGANFSRTILNGTVFLGADLTNANLNSSVIGVSNHGNATFSRARLTGATFDGAKIEGADFQYAELPRALSESPVFAEAILTRPVGTASSTDEIVCGEADLSVLQSRIYVSTNGSDTLDCGESSAAACLTVEMGILRCRGSNCGVLVAYGEYDLWAPLILRSGVDLYGGCRPRSQSRPTDYSLINGSGGGNPVLSATGITEETLLQGFHIVAPSETRPGRPSIAMVISNSSKLKFLDMNIVPGSGAPGADGVTGAGGADGNSANGQTGGTNAGCAKTAGGSGGDERPVKAHEVCSYQRCDPAQNRCKKAQGGQPGTTGSAASGGLCGGDICAESSDDDPGNGANGGAGKNGSCGINGAPSPSQTGSFSGVNWTAVMGGSGTSGGDGGGGGGGGSGGYKQTWKGCKTKSHSGERGGGGGAGGCGGTGGGGGQQGGASIGLILVNSTLSAQRTRITMGRGGNGGNGGNGSSGGGGGAGGQPGEENSGGDGGKGGTGGWGGIGGAGAPGNGGPSVGVAIVGPEPSFLDSTDVLYYQGTEGSPGIGGTSVTSTPCQQPSVVGSGLYGELAEVRQFNMP